MQEQRRERGRREARRSRRGASTLGWGRRRGRSSWRSGSSPRLRAAATTGAAAGATGAAVAAACLEERGPEAVAVPASVAAVKALSAVAATRSPSRRTRSFRASGLSPAASPPPRSPSCTMRRATLPDLRATSRPPCTCWFTIAALLRRRGTRRSASPSPCTRQTARRCTARGGRALSPMAVAAGRRARAASHRRCDFRTFRHCSPSSR